MKKVAVSILCLCAIVSTGRAAAYWYDMGSGNGRWDTPTNWYNNALPVSTEGAYIAHTAVHCLIDSATQAKCAYLVVGNTWALIPVCYLDITGGTLDVGPGFAFYNFYVGDGDGVGGAEGVVTQDGGKVTVGGELGIGVRFGTGTYYLNGGTVDANILNISSGLLRIGNGKLSLRAAADQTTQINNYISSGFITLRDSGNVLRVSRDNITKTTTVVAVNAGKAWGPSPADAGNGVGYNPILSWSSGSGAISHHLYFGSDLAGVTARSSSVDKGMQTAPYTPGILDLGKTYYWVVDEVKTGGVVVPGDVWSFTCATSTMIDDFEPYSTEAAIDAVWTQTYNDPCNLSIDSYSPYNHRMKLKYNNLPGQVSTATRNISVNNWTAVGKALGILIYGGDPGINDPVFVKLQDNLGNISTVYNNDLATLRLSDTFHQWNIPLTAFSGVNMANVTKITVGIGKPSGAGGTGNIFFDDIALYPARCLNGSALTADLNGDCVVGFKDFAVMAEQWAQSGIFP